MYFAFIKHRRIFYIFSLILILLSAASIIVFGLKLGIDFTGGSALEVKYEQTPPSFSSIRSKLADLNLGEMIIQKSSDNGIIIKVKSFKKSDKEILKRLGELGKIKEGSASFQSIGPTVGEELKKKTTIVTILALLTILAYIAFSFRRVSRPVNSYIYGVTSIVALCHDVFIPIGVLAVLGKYQGVEVSIPIITAFLTIFGYSINDSVVVFDRIRENIMRMRGANFDLTVEESLNQTVARSLNTSLTTLIVLFAIFLFGGESLKYFSLMLIIGIASGTYSSIFLASPLLVSYLHFKERKSLKNKKK